MITIDFQCSNSHRFEGSFKDYDSYKSQHDGNIISCPLCNTSAIKRIFSCCSIQPKNSVASNAGSNPPTLFDFFAAFNNHVRDNYVYVGSEFADMARSIYYGMKDYHPVYGEASPDEIRELQEEGVGILPLIDVEKINN